MSEEQDRTVVAHQIVSKYRILALTVGLLPFTLMDAAALSAIQLSMLRDLANLYQVEFSQDRGKSILAVLVSGVSVYPVAGLARHIPVLGSFTGLVTISLFGAASTYAVGRVFIQHFESGGTLLTLDPEKVRNYYASQLPGGAEPRESYIGVKP